MDEFVANSLYKTIMRADKNYAELDSVWPPSKGGTEGVSPRGIKVWILKLVTRRFIRRTASE